MRQLGLGPRFLSRIRSGIQVKASFHIFAFKNLVLKCMLALPALPAFFSKGTLEKLQPRITDYESRKQPSQGILGFSSITLLSSWFQLPLHIHIHSAQTIERMTAACLNAWHLGKSPNSYAESYGMKSYIHDCS